MAGRRARHARRPGARSQHFIRSRRLARELVRDACVGSEDLVVEIGAGTGLLTAELARRAGHVLAIELDPLLAGDLRRRFAASEAVAVLECDAVGAPLPAEPFAVVANIPFSRTNDVLRSLFDDPRTPLLRADLIVQWGAAVKRAAVWPSTLLGVCWGAWYGFSLARRLSARCFSPRPSVDAGVLVARRRPEPLVDAADWRAYRSFVRRGFEHGLRAVVPARRLRGLADELGFARDAAPRELDAYQWAALFCSRRPDDSLSSRPTRRPL